VCIPAQYETDKDKRTEKKMMESPEEVQPNPLISHK